MLMGCCTGRSQSVYSLIIVANISFKWKLYVLRTYVRSIFARRSASMPYWMSSELNEKNASARVTPTIKSYLSDIDVIIIPEGGSISKNERKRKTKKNAKSLRNGCIKKMKCAIEWKKCVKLVDLPSSTRRRCHPRPVIVQSFRLCGASVRSKRLFHSLDTQFVVCDVFRCLVLNVMMMMAMTMMCLILLCSHEFAPMTSRSTLENLNTCGCVLDKLAPNSINKYGEEKRLPRTSWKVAEHSFWISYEEGRWDFQCKWKWTLEKIEEWNFIVLSPIHVVTVSTAITLPLHPHEYDRSIAMEICTIFNGNIVSMLGASYFIALYPRWQSAMLVVFGNTRYAAITCFENIPPMHL